MIPHQIVRRRAYGLLLGAAGPDAGHSHVRLRIAWSQNDTFEEATSVRKAAHP